MREAHQVPGEPVPADVGALPHRAVTVPLEGPVQRPALPGATGVVFPVRAHQVQGTDVLPAHGGEVAGRQLGDAAVEELDAAFAKLAK